MKENILDQEWDVPALLKFAFPTIVMMIFMGLYTITDTIFVARLVNADALSAINIVCPVINLTVGLGTMLAAGGNAIVSRKMGAGANEEAREDFTLLVIVALAMGLILLTAGLFWMEEIIVFLGASDRLFPYCREYLTALSFLRTFGLLAGNILVLPRVWGIPGVWLAVPVAEGVMFVVSLGCLGFFRS